MAEVSSGDSRPVLATIATSADGWFRAVSPHFLAMLGGPVEALAGLNAVDLVHPMQASKVRQALVSAATADEQTIATQLFLGDTWTPIEIIIERMVDERSTWRLYHPVQTPAPSLPIEPAKQAAAVTPASGSDDEMPPAVSVLPAALLPRPVSVPSPADAVSTAKTRQTGAGDRAALLPGEVAGDFPYEDSDAHMAYVALMPPDSVPAQRDQVRRSVGDESTPMLEIDVDGRTSFVRGRWNELSSHDSLGVDVFEDLIESSGQADQILTAIGHVFETAEPSNHPISIPDGLPLWIRVLPIPSPHLAGVVHALIAVVDEAALDSATDVEVHAPSGHQVRLDKLPAATGPSTAGRLTETSDRDESDPVPSDQPSALTPDSAAPRQSKSRRLMMFAGLAMLAGIIVLVFALSRDDQATAPQPASVSLIETELVQVNDTQTWQAIGAESLGELQSVATTPTGGFAAEVTGRLFRLDAQGAASEAIRISGEETVFITDIAADETGVVWVLDAGLGRVSRVAPDGTVTPIAANPSLLNARGAGVGLDNTLFVASTASAQLIQIGIDGQFVNTIALPGRQPSDVAQAADGTLWIVDAEQLELVHLSEDGELLRAVAIEPFSSLQSPHLTFADDVLWVTAPESSAVLVIDTETGQPTGERVDLTRPDGSLVSKPVGIAATADGQLWIPDSSGGAIITVRAEP